MIARYDFDIAQGSDVDIPIVLRDAENVQMNLTGFGVHMQIREFADSDDVVDELTNSNDRIAIDEEAGRFVLKFPHSVTERLPAQSLSYDIELVSSDGKIRRILEGHLRVSREITRVSVR